MPDISEDVLRRYGADGTVRARIQRVVEWDMAFLTTTFNDDLIRSGRPYSCEQVYPIMVRFGKADHEIAQLLCEEFRKFAILTLLKPGVPHAPPGAVDMFWHFFILHTEQYRDFCEKVWGDFRGDPKYRDHYPSTDLTRAGQFRAYAATLDLYRDVFGEPKMYERVGSSPVAVWTPVAVTSKGGGGSTTSGDSFSGTIDPLPEELAGVDLNEMMKMGGVD